MKIQARARPAKIEAPARADVAALTRPEVFDKWNAGLRAAADSADNVISVLDVIGEDYWSGGGVTAKRVAAALRSIGNRDIEVHVNSPGGDMFEGIAIYNQLREHPGKVTVKVMGLAASAASIIAMAGDEVQIGSASFLMIHNCWVMAMGNRHDMAETAAFLEPFDAAMADVYAARSGQAKEDIAAWMDAEKWIGGQEAIDLGFADTLLATDAVKEDGKAKKAAAAHNATRQAEIALCAQMSRSEARALIGKLKGTPGAAQPATPGAGDTEWTAAFTRLTSTLSPKS